MGEDDGTVSVAMAMLQSSPFCRHVCFASLLKVLILRLERESRSPEGGLNFEVKLKSQEINYLELEDIEGAVCFL